MDYRRFALLPCLLVALACGSTSGRPTTIAEPDIDLALAQEIFFGSSATAPATFEVRVRNNATVPISLRRVDLETPAMTEWGFPRQSRSYNEVIQPGETRSVRFFATAYTNTSRRSEPLSFRARLEFQAGGTRWHELVHEQSNVFPV